VCIEHWLALSVENLIAEDADDFFSEKGCFTSTVTRTKRPWLWTATPTPWTRAILASNDDKRNFIYRQLHKYRPTY